MSDWRSNPPVLPSLLYRWPERMHLPHAGPMTIWHDHSGALRDHVLLIFHRGSSGDPISGNGLHDITARLLLSGTRIRDRQAVAESMERWGSSITARVTADATILSLRCLRDSREALLDLVEDILHHSTFPEEEVQRVRAQKLDSLRADLNDPGTLATLLVLALFFEGTPYSHPSQGTLSGIETLERPDILEAHRRLLHSGVSLSGLGPEPGPWVRCASQWPQVSEKKEDSLAFQKRKTLAVYPREGSVQSEIRMAIPVPPDLSFHSVLILNTIFGGQFSSRLNLNLREQHGYTYGIRSTLVRRRHARYILVTAAVHNEATLPALQEIQNELRGLADSGPRVNEQEAAVTFLSGSMARALESPDAFLGKILDSILAGDPEDHFIQFHNRLQSLSLNNLKETASRLFGEDAETVTVAVGAPDTVQSLPSALLLTDHPFV